MLNRADRLTELQAKVDTLKPDDAAWKRVFYVLMSAASKTKDYSYLISKAEALAQAAADSDIKAQARFMIGDAYWSSKDIDRARKALKRGGIVTLGDLVRRTVCDLASIQGLGPSTLDEIMGEVNRLGIELRVSPM